MSATEHILVLDDDGDVRDVLVEVLRDHGYRVSWAVDGRSMRDFLQGEDPVDAVVLDAAMPGEASGSLALYAKERGLPVVMISGSPDLIQFAADNDLQLLKNPFRGHELVAAIVQALGSGEAGQRTLALLWLKSIIGHCFFGFLAILWKDFFLPVLTGYEHGSGIS